MALMTRHSKLTMPAEVQHYWNELVAKNELTRSDVSIYPSYTNLTLPYRVVCRQRYARNAKRNRTLYLLEVMYQELLQSRVLDAIRLFREYSKVIIVPLDPEDIITLSAKDQRKLDILMAEN
ncbi:uncharacterized protein LOC112905154 [Agrilus planipennis]|uniref:Uncharacterized protein LOC112905154 n=1 Tax=Agrilus planipennis TaxID=224129 RepID=A0A7F5RA04_AGRPL|nr:uncharacterized protein LOC112905154 [Agrilus planipennis]